MGWIQPAYSPPGATAFTYGYHGAEDTVEFYPNTVAFGWRKFKPLDVLILAGMGFYPVGAQPLRPMDPVFRLNQDYHLPTFTIGEGARCYKDIVFKVVPTLFHVTTSREDWSVVQQQLWVGIVIPDEFVETKEA